MNSKPRTQFTPPLVGNPTFPTKIRAFPDIPDKTDIFIFDKNLSINHLQAYHQNFVGTDKIEGTSPASRPSGRGILTSNHVHPSFFSLHSSFALPLRPKPRSYLNGIV